MRWETTIEHNNSIAWQVRIILPPTNRESHSSSSHKLIILYSSFQDPSAWSSRITCKQFVQLPPCQPRDSTAQYSKLTTALVRHETRSLTAPCIVHSSGPPTLHSTPPPTPLNIIPTRPLNTSREHPRGSQPRTHCHKTNNHETNIPPPCARSRSCCTPAAIALSTPGALAADRRKSPSTQACQLAAKTQPSTPMRLTSAVPALALMQRKRPTARWD